MKRERKTKPALWTLVHQKRAKKVERKRIRSSTPRRARELSRYRQRVKVWLTLPENKFCGAHIWVNGVPRASLNPAGVVDFSKLPKAPSTQCHHRRGRMGKLLLMEEHWVPVCDDCHRWIHSHVEKARDIGLIAPLGLWNTALAKIK